MTIEQRLERLERRTNRYRNALVMLVMSVCSVALIGATTDDGIIRGKGLFITNDEGMPVLWAKVTSDGVLLAYRELDDTLGLFDVVSTALSDLRSGRNIQHAMTTLRGTP